MLKEVKTFHLFKLKYQNSGVFAVPFFLFPPFFHDWRPFNKNEEMMHTFVVVDIYTSFTYLVSKVWIQTGCWWYSFILCFRTIKYCTKFDVFFIFINFICSLLLTR